MHPMARHGFGVTAAPIPRDIRHENAYEPDRRHGRVFDRFRRSCATATSAVARHLRRRHRSGCRPSGDRPKKWIANGKDIAAFLSGANPYWPKKDLEHMLQTHLDLTTGEVVGRLRKDWAADIKSYDDGHVHMLMFADMLAGGIAKQFAATFKQQLDAPTARPL